jgi:hypothetical protein
LQLHLKVLAGQAEESARKKIHCVRLAERLSGGLSQLKLAKAGHTS